MAWPGTFYILGAGTSKGLVPTIAETYGCMVDQYWKVGMFPVSSDFRGSPLHDRLVRRDNRKKYGLKDLVLGHSPIFTLELLVQKAWSPPVGREPPPHYAVLRKCARGVIFSFNLDGLAQTHLSDVHLVLAPHGAVEPSLIQEAGFEARLESSLDIWPPPSRSNILAGPEPSFITGTQAYLDARTHLRRAPAVIILGYSFGTFEGRMDDVESFEYLIDIQSGARSTIFVADPNPEPIAASIADRLKCNRVVPIVLYWDTFSCVLNKLMGPLGQVPHSHWLHDSQLGLLLEFYGRTLGEDRRRLR